MMDYFTKESLTDGNELNLSVQKSPENALKSPLGISRYGRTRKPKITQDFCDIDDAIESTSGKNVAQKRSHSKSPTKSPKKFRCYISKSDENIISIKDDVKIKQSTVPRFPKILHVTGDCISYEDIDVEQSTLDSDISPVKTPESFKIRKFFKSNVQGTKLQTMTQLYINKTNQVYTPSKDNVKIESPLKPTNENIFTTSAIDVSKVFKIISSKSNELKETKAYSKPILKTYSNKRKHFNKPVVIESFALPDETIIPLDEEICVKPLRISEIDVADVPEAQNVNLTDAWQIKTEDDDEAFLNLTQEVDIRQLPEKPERDKVIDVKDELLDYPCEDIKTENCDDLKLEKDLNTPAVGEDQISEIKNDIDDCKLLLTKNNNNNEVTDTSKVNNNNEVTDTSKVNNNTSDSVELKKEKQLYSNNKEVCGVTKGNEDVKCETVENENQKVSCNNTEPELINQETKKLENKDNILIEIKSSAIPIEKFNNSVTVNTSHASEDASIIDQNIKTNANKMEEILCSDLHPLNEKVVLIKMIKPVYKHINKLKRRTKLLLKRPSLRSSTTMNFPSDQEQAKLNNHMKSSARRKRLDLEKTEESKKLERDSPLKIKKESIDIKSELSSPPDIKLEDNNPEITLNLTSESSDEKPLSDMSFKVEADYKIEANLVKRSKKSESPQPKRLLRSSVGASDSCKTSPNKIMNSSKKDNKRRSNTKNNGSGNGLLNTSVKNDHVRLLDCKVKLFKEADLVEVKLEKPILPSKTHSVENLKKTPLNTDTPEYDLGDIMWAKVGSHPYWPCLISKEPTTSVFKKSQKRMVIYHVRFFGDNGRRSWVPVRNLVPFKEHNLSKQQTGADSKNTPIVPPQNKGKFKNWTVGVKEANSLVNKSVEERFGFFFDMFATKREKMNIVKKSLGQKDKLQLSLNIGKRQQKITNVKTKRSNSLPVNIVKEINKTKMKEEIEDTQSNDEKQSWRRVTRSSLLKSTLEPSLKLDKKTSEDREVISKELLEMVHKQNTPQREILGSEYSLSDTDSNSKLSVVNSPIPFTFESQEALHKRNNLFRGVTKERACQICEKTGNVIKCKGRCSGFYHVNCARVIKPSEMTSNSDLGQENGSSKEKLSVTMNMQEIQINSSEDKDQSDKKEIPNFKNINDVQIIQIKDRRKLGTPPKLLLNPDPQFKKLPLYEQIDHKMKEVMEKLEDKASYADSTTDYTSSEESLPESSEKIKLAGGITAPKAPLVTKPRSVKQKNDCTRINECSKPNSANNSIAKSNNDNHSNDIDFKCNDCLLDVDPVCFVCHEKLSKTGSSIRQKCSIFPCGKFYHPECLKMWPQTQWSLIATMQHKQSNKMLDTFVCPVHVCHTCVSDDPRTAISRCTSDKVVKCLRCPATYHTSTYCVPAGTEILSSTQIVCPRHLGPVGKGKHRKSMSLTINTTWCFICSQGGDLICCETCPTSVHVDCLKINLLDDDTFICEDCETGRFPLYDEIVWVKLGTYRWWPAVILFPNEVPDNIKNVPHNKGEFVVKFFGTHDHYWIGRGRVFLFQEGDTGGQTISVRKKVDAVFLRSVEEAKEAHRLKKDFKVTKEAEIKTGLKPPPFIKIKVNRPVGNVRQFDGNISNTTPCECDPKQSNPCGPDSDCLNRLLLTECDPEVCPAGEKCQNQNFEKRNYPPLVPYKTQSRGWGLKSSESIKKGHFVIEYVGELIDEQEYQRRIKKMHEQKEENYYFLTIDKDRMIDAGPKGNVARFMNHSCQPNCETQKWTVNGDTRVGLFATFDIPADTELTFNYNLECVGKEKKICKCGAPKCSGFIGVKVKLDESQKKPKKSLSKLKKRKQLPTVQTAAINNDPCFVCGKTGNVGTCHNKICTKFYHLKCVNLKTWPDNKWVCPWHNCNVCSKRTIRCCVKCISSYCPVHSEGNIRYDKLLGFVCLEHDPSKESHEIQVQSTNKQDITLNKLTDESDVTSTTCDEIDQSPLASKNHQSRQKLNASPKIKKTKSSSVNTSTSTPVKGDNSSLIEEFETFSSENSVCQEADNLKEQVRKRGRPRKAVIERHKKIKLDNKSEIKTNVIKPQNPSPNLINSYSVENEVILSSTVPSRHLRASKITSDVEENDRFLKRQREYEKDLPIRKRSTLRCETTT